MMDDSLSDVQQEKKMSVERLVLNDVQKEIKMYVDKGKDDKFNFMSVENGKTIWLIIDRNQAHILMLYLQQHLGYVSISKDRLDEGTHK
jgi:hypothetical protein